MAGAWQPSKAGAERFKIVDSVPEDASRDADFLKAIQDLQEQQGPRGGWLTQRGAFDKGDLLYLKDEEERRRHVEEDMEEKERNQFLAARQKLDEEEQERRRASAAAAAATAKAAALKKEQEAAKKRKIIPIVKVKPAVGGVAPSDSDQGTGHQFKRSKSNTTTAPIEEQDKIQGKEKADEKPDTQPVVAQPRRNPSIEATISKSEGNDDSGGLGGLGDLLGGYASSSDSD